jgi:hypothetical protein
VNAHAKSTLMNPETRVNISPSVYVRSFGEELVLLDFGRGEYFGLDEVGGEIWRRLEAGDSLSRIADSIVQQYDVEKEIALRDIVELVSRLSNHSLVTIAAAPNGA